jgi:hypothetical protein
MARGTITEVMAHLSLAILLFTPPQKKTPLLMRTDSLCFNQLQGGRASYTRINNKHHNTMTTTKVSPIKKAARAALLGTHVSGGRGRTDKPAAVTWSTPVVVVPSSAQPPTLKGLPYWKTTMRNGTFSRTLYTPSTMRIVVGENWKH